MKKSLIAASFAVVGSLAFTSIAAADEISNTGPGSTNTINSNIGKSCYVNNNNQVYVSNNNQQVGTTGSATVVNNTNSGQAQSGDATNTNEGTFTGTINNSGACVAPVAVTPTQPTGGNGGGQVESAQTTAAAKPQVQKPTGGVKAGNGGSDQSGLLIGLVSASVLAIGAGLRRLQLQKQQ